MPKVLSTKEYENLLNKANNYDSVVASIVEGDPDLKAEEITSDIIQEFMKPESSSVDPELLSKYNQLKENYNSVVSEKEEIQNQLNNLLNSAGEDGAIATSQSEVNGKPKSLADKFNENRGDTAVILETWKQEGLI